MTDIIVSAICAAIYIFVFIAVLALQALIVVAVLAAILFGIAATLGVVAL